ncbi:MAG: IreB family regulatory phosphoprotein [Erysipelothrix sp.]|nr:IreB family regulatory phosphoprotein [Erysipelothrix sp.]
MENKDLTETMAYSTESIRQENIHRIMVEVAAALEERGYNAVNQLAGYLITNDPAYISSHRGARSKIQQLERFEIIEELMRVYLAND